ncbi:phage tail spike protein [Latilactobacillus curvatus]|uniref:phage tail spike protein n=1 Tax=Latilactobacillus curvatus TaxID=28038 RepID=UPI0020A2F21D|nr:phage tail spike protein [Latilactobacillus curvatus]UTC12504.1 hypothetical protein A4W75_05275 [Latilactobacillus curvatus]
MITFYKADETDFDNNGLGVLDRDIQNPDIEEKLNDIFTFSFNYPIFAVNGARLAARMIVKADDPENEGQLFRIMKLSKSNGMLTAFCYHIFYDLNGNEIPDTNIVGQNGQTAITQMLSKTAVGHKFQGFSDIAETANIRVVRMSPVKFLLDTQTDNNFINRLGGEIRRVNYRIWMNKIRGSDNGATIRWKKSLDSYNATWDYTTVATRIRPVGYNGIMLPESYVDSPLINSYETIVIKEIQYSDIKAIDPDATSNDETAVPLEEAYRLMRAAAAKEFSDNHIDEPTVTLTVNMVALRNAEEYKDVQSLETINPWDTVTVINERDGLSVKVRLNHYHWNPVTRKFISMELGNAKSTFTDIGSKVDHATNLANQANDTANTAAESANGKNSNYYGLSEPSRPVDGDLWYKKNGDKTELWQYDGKSVPPGWKLVVDDATGEEVRQNVDAAQKEAEEAKKQANTAVDGANDAVAKAGFANDAATQAKSDATTAKADAATAKGQATNALGQANTAINNAANALDKFNNISIGGTNLLTDSGFESGNVPANYVWGDGQTSNRTFSISSYAETYPTPMGKFMLQVGNWSTDPAVKLDQYVCWPITPVIIKKGETWTYSYYYASAGGATGQASDYLMSDGLLPILELSMAHSSRETSGGQTTWHRFVKTWTADRDVTVTNLRFGFVKTSANLGAGFALIILS